MTHLEQLPTKEAHSQQASWADVPVRLTFYTAPMSFLSYAEASTVLLYVIISLHFIYRADFTRF